MQNVFLVLVPDPAEPALPLSPSFRGVVTQIADRRQHGLHRQRTQDCRPDHRGGQPPGLWVRGTVHGSGAGGNQEQLRMRQVEVRRI